MALATKIKWACTLRPPGRDFGADHSVIDSHVRARLFRVPEAADSVFSLTLYGYRPVSLILVNGIELEEQLLVGGTAFGCQQQPGVEPYGGPCFFASVPRGDSWQGSATRVVSTSRTCAAVTTLSWTSIRAL